MKIVCDSCATKYSISDDKVRGKVFKIRCKKCSHIIVVRGTNEAASAASSTATPAVVAAADGGWHLVVDGDQVGPVPESDIRARIERGEINAETYVWKDGFADWLKLSAVPEFAQLVTPADGGVFADGSGSGAVNGDGGGHQPAGAGLFGAGSASSEEADVFGGLAPAASKRGAAGDLFAAPAVASRSAAEDSRWPAASAAPAGHDGGRVENLTGQRHENSVLFSLSNLQSLAMPAPATRAVSSTAPTTEGSGLIDIRAMAATTLGSSSGRGSSFGGGGPADDLPSFGGFSPAAPVLLALPSNSGPPKWIYAALGVLVLLVGAIAVMAIKILGTAPVTAVEPAAGPAAPVAAAPGGNPSAPVAAAAPAAAPTTIAPENLPPREAPKAEAKGEGKEGKSEGKSEHHRSGKGEKAEKAEKGHEASSGSTVGRKGGEEKKAVAAALTAEPAAEKKPTKGSLDDLLEGALNHKGGGGAAAKPRVEEDSPRKSEAAGSGPLAKSAVVAGMNSVKGKIAECYSQFKVSGMAMVNVVIGKSGHVSAATVTGKFAGTPTGACVERAVKSASFPPSDGLSTPYPFQLK
jgi:predicted Zn finger-like uncharacterized protein